MWSVWSVQNTERTVPHTQEIEIVLRNPINLSDTLSYYINVPKNDFNDRWLTALEKNLQEKYHLEKNYCWIGWADSPRDVEYLCQELNRSISQINKFNRSGVWQEHGLKNYEIKDVFTPDTVMYDPKIYPIGKMSIDPNNKGLSLKHDAMNKLHRYFEKLQGEAWKLSLYYKIADYQTKWAIRQLNVLCHELEGFVSALRKSKIEPEWQRPSQITTFLNAPRQELQKQDYNLFLDNGYDRELGGVYLHWAQVGKTHYEVFRDEHGQDIDNATCSAISSLRYFTGEFDIEWGKDITYDSAEWHREEQKKFIEWLSRNGMNHKDPTLSLGYIKIAQVDLEKSFGSSDFHKIISMLSKHLDIYKIITPNTSSTFDYVWSDDNYKKMQIDFLKPGYDWSRNNV